MVLSLSVCPSVKQTPRRQGGDASRPHVLRAMTRPAPISSGLRKAITMFIPVPATECRAWIGKCWKQSRWSGNDESMEVRPAGAGNGEAGGLPASHRVLTFDESILVH